MFFCQIIFLDKLLWMAEDLEHYCINAKKDNSFNTLGKRFNDAVLGV